MRPWGPYPERVTTSALAQATLASPYGPLELAATSAGLAAAAFRSSPADVTRDVARRGAVAGSLGQRTADDDAAARRWLDAARRQIEAYLAGRLAAFELPLDLGGLSAWDRRVLEGVRTIAYGATAGYGEIARRIGARGAARAVGGAVSRNPVALVIPCHRVIAGDGTLGGYGGSWPADRDDLLDLKRALLTHEGVRVPDRRAPHGRLAARPPAA